MITLCPYNLSWPALFSAEKIKLEAALLNVATRIEHIGSTAIPGIHAKPVIDILIAVNSLQQLRQEQINQLIFLGYRYMPELEVTFPHRRFFLKEDAQGNRTHQVHIVNYPSAWWERHILFRDYLRENSQQAHAYEDHKLSLAQQFDNSNEYAQAKTEFCNNIHRQAFHSSRHQPFLQTERFAAYIPQLACLNDYTLMLEDPAYIACYGKAFNKAEILQRIESDINHWDQHGFGPWMWYDKQTQHYVGRIGIKTFQEDVELAYSLMPQYWAQGITKTLSCLAIDYAFNQLDLENLVCFTRQNNDSSLAVMQKLGFQYEKDFKQGDDPCIFKYYRKIRTKSA